MESVAEGWVVDAEGALRREKIPSMLRRLVGWDYKARAIYQITVTLARRSSDALGRLEVRLPGGEWVPVREAKAVGLAAEGLAARVALNDDGRAVAAALGEMALVEPKAEILASQVMPDHCHFIVFVKAPLDRPMGQLVRGFKAGAAKRWKALRENAQALDGGAAGENAQALGRGMPEARGGGAVRSVLANSFASLPVWADGFQDTILLREGQLAHMRRYLADNPRRLAVKRLFPDLFRVVSRLSVGLPGGEGHFMALGNRFLLERPMAQIQVSRADFRYRRVPKPGGGLKIARDSQGEPLVEHAAREYAERRERLLAAARHGVVLLSPCVSDGERQLAHEALNRGFPLIVLQNKGFSPLAKPSGRHFDACADGRLLLLAPAAWPWQPGEKPMTRQDATAMNRLCQWIAGESAAEIDYHGQHPADIDALAAAAVGFRQKQFGLRPFALAVWTGL